MLVDGGRYNTIQATRYQNAESPPPVTSPSAPPPPLTPNTQPVFKVYGGEGPAATGEHYGSFADMLNESTYGRVIAPRSASASLTMQMGVPWGKAACTKDSKVKQSELALERLKTEVDFDLDVYDFRMFLLSDRNDTNRKSCGWYGIAEGACGHPSKLPIRTWGFFDPDADNMKPYGTPRPKCNSWFFTDSKTTIGHELGHNLVSLPLTFACIAHVSSTIKTSLRC